MSSSYARYKTNLKFWMGVNPDVDGMLQGYGHLSSSDAEFSTKFLKSLMEGDKAVTKSGKALDCGAGIGRVSKLVLLPLFNQVDLIDQTKHFIDNAPNFIGPELVKKVGKFHCCGLQDFQPSAHGPYDVVWIQWVIGYLTDSDLVAFFDRCKKALTNEGMLVIKDNMKKSGESDADDEDGSVCRYVFMAIYLFVVTCVV